MLKIQEIREMIKLVDQSNIDEFVYEHEGSKIMMKKQSVNAVLQTMPSKAVAQQPILVEEQPNHAAAPALATPTKAEVNETEQPKSVVIDENLHKIVSPMVGTFYSSPSPDAEAYVKVGDKVNESKIVCIVEAMKLFNEIEAEVNGEIVETLVENGQLVEYGQPLFLVKPE